MDAVEIFDTTLRDGLQVEGVSASVEDKLRIAEQLDLLGVRYIEGGWPGANPKDIEFFARARDELTLATSTLVAFGSTAAAQGQGRRRPDAAQPDRGRHRRRLHRRQELRVPRDRGAADDARRGRGDDRRLGRVPDGQRSPRARRHGALLRRLQERPEFSLRALEAAVVKGATHVVLCDTNGGSLPHEIEADRRRRLPPRRAVT